MNTEQAEIIALQALAYLTSNEKERAAFIAQTGIGMEELKEMACDSDALGSVLDFLLSNEKRLLACCEELDWPPELPSGARRQLPGTTSGIGI